MQILTFRSPVTFEGYRTYSDEVETIPYVIFKKFLNLARINLDLDPDRVRFGKGLAEYLPEEMANKIPSITIDIHDYLDKEAVLETVCVVSTNLNEYEIETLKEWIEGQLSDGFGEGFEQINILDESNEKEFYDIVHTKLWNDSDWKLDLIDKYEF